MMHVVQCSMTICKEIECNKIEYSRGWCRSHHKLLFHTLTKIIKCVVSDCNEPSLSKDMCNKHYLRYIRKGTTDPVNKNRDIMLTGVKMCNHCNEIKRYDEFYKTARGYPRAYCKECMNGGLYMDKEKHRAREINKRKARRKQLIEMLGGKCEQCGTIDNLEFDHLDPSQKLFTIGAKMNNDWDTLVVEAKKCRLLCSKCHRKHTATQNRK